MKKLIMFVMVLAISAPSMADDLNPPDWALGPGTIYGIWEFPSASSGQEGDYPEVGEMVSHATNPDPEEMTSTSDPDEIAHQYMEISYSGIEDWLEIHEGREGVVEGGMSFWANNFPGAGTKLIRLQVTWTGSEISIFYIGAGGGTYTGPVEWFPLSEDVLIENGTVDLGDGWYHSTYEFLIEGNPSWEWVYVGATGNGPIYIDQIVIDTICYPGAEPPPGPGGRGVEPAPIVIDPNVMTVYETDETEGDFGVSLRNQPPPGATITVTVDPNGDGNAWNEDIRLLGVTNPLDPNNTITLTFTATTGGDPCDPCSWTPGNCTDWDPVARKSCWNVPQTIIFKAIDDDIAEPPAQLEPQAILVSSSWPGHETDANFVGETYTTVKVMDNDQANILFELVGTGPIRETPVTLFEWVNCTYWYLGVCYNWVTFPQTVGVTLQVEPENDANPGSQGYVRVIVANEGESGNQPIMDPCLVPEHAHTPGDPNAIVFTSDGNPAPAGVIGTVRKWDVPFNIVLLGNDDEELQAEGAEAEGGQYYNAYLAFLVTDTSDDRYTGLEQSVDIEIEDNECGAYGISYLDIGNSDPCAIDEEGYPLPDCYVDIYDIIEFATRWLNCSDPQDLTPGGPCTSYIVE